MKVDFIPKRQPHQAYMDAPDRDWIRLTDFSDRVTYFSPDEARELIKEIAAILEKL